MTHDSFDFYVVVPTPPAAPQPEINWCICEYFWPDLELVHGPLTDGRRLSELSVCTALCGWLVTIWSSAS